jgi:ERCC4-type nuclease
MAPSARNHAQRPAPTTTIPKVVVAACPENQYILDQLNEIRHRVNVHTPKSRYYFTIQRAVQSMMQHPHPIQNYADALLLKHIGPSIATKINFLPTTTAASTTTTTAAASDLNSRKVPKRGRQPNLQVAMVTAATTATTEDHDTGVAVTTFPHASPTQKRQRCCVAGGNNNHNNDDAGTTTVTMGGDGGNSRATTGTARTIEPLPSYPKGRKQLQYEQAIAEAKLWRERLCASLLQDSGGDRHRQNDDIRNTAARRRILWRVVLLIDVREQWCEYIQAKCTMSGLPCESRTLPIGDMMWIVQGIVHQDTSPSRDNANGVCTPNVVVELLLGTILERKTPEDLKQSIFGSRYMEQRLRLQNCGVPQIIFLIEGDANKDLYACPMETLQTAIWETRLSMNFSVLHTSHAEDTVQTLKRIHRRILQRAFPRTFQNQLYHTIGTSNGTAEALPTFREAVRTQIGVTKTLGVQRPSLSENRINGTNTATTTTATDQQRRYRRERRSSLANLTFDSDPVLPLGMKRFMTYQELKTKIMYDREVGTQSVHHLHLAMLKQVPTFNQKKCYAIASIYPTIHSLCSAYHQSMRRSATTTTEAMVATTGTGPCPNHHHSATTMVLNLPLQNDARHPPSTTMIVQRNIGERSSEALFITYTGGVATLSSDQIPKIGYGDSTHVPTVHCRPTYNEIDLCMEDSDDDNHDQVSPYRSQLRRQSDVCSATRHDHHGKETIVQKQKPTTTKICQLGIQCHNTYSSNSSDDDDSYLSFKPMNKQPHSRVASKPIDPKDIIELD